MNSVIIANDPSTFDIKADVINSGFSDVPAGDSIEVWIAVNGDFGTASPWDGYFLDPNNIGPLRPYDPIFSPMRARLSTANSPGIYTGWGPNANRFSGGSGQVHVITIWPAKVTGGSTPVGIADTFTTSVLYIGAAGFRVSHNGVSGISPTTTIQYTRTYDIDIEAENIGIGASSAPLEYYVKLDDYNPVLLGTSTNIIPVNGTNLQDVPTFKLSNLYSHLNLPPNFDTEPHEVIFFAQEQGLQNSMQVATYDVDAANAFPVTLVGFDGKLVEDQIQLEWATSEEENNSHFFVEKFNPVTERYEEIGRVDGAGISALQHNYHLTDYFPLMGTNLYRLSQVDFDGSEALLGNIVEVTYTIDQADAEVLVLYPNPVTDMANLRVKNPLAQEALVEVFDINGIRVYENAMPVPAGVINIEMDLSSLLAGTYVYQVVLGDLPLTGKLLKY